MSWAVAFTSIIPVVAASSWSSMTRLTTSTRPRSRSRCSPRVTSTSIAKRSVPVDGDDLRRARTLHRGQALVAGDADDACQSRCCIWPRHPDLRLDGGGPRPGCRAQAGPDSALDAADAARRRRARGGADSSASGAYDLGFVAIGPGADSTRLLCWWAQRLRHDCILDHPMGLFVDQRWFDMARR